MLATLLQQSKHSIRLFWIGKTYEVHISAILS